MQTNNDKSETRRLGQRYTVQEAAELLETTVDGVRSRIRRGTLDSMKVAGTVYVLLTPDQAGQVEPSPDQSEIRRDDSSDPQARDDLLKAKEETIAELRDQVAYMRAELRRRGETYLEESRRKDSIIMAMAQRIPELEASQEPRDGHETASEHRTGGETSEGFQGPAQRRSWWRRFFDFR